MNRENLSSKRKEKQSNNNNNNNNRSKSQDRDNSIINTTTDIHTDKKTCKL
jgi:hypothetical protein